MSNIPDEEGEDVMVQFRLDRATSNRLNELIPRGNRAKVYTVLTHAMIQMLESPDGSAYFGKLLLGKVDLSKALGLESR